MRRAAIALVIILGLITLWIARPFLVPILFGAVVAALLEGLHDRMKRRMSSQLSAVILTLGSVLLVFLPMTLLMVSGVRTAATKLKTFQQSAQVDTSSREALADTLVQVPAVERFVSRISDFFGMDTQQIVQSAEGLVQRGAMSVANFLTSFIAKVPQFTVEIFLVLLAIYFVLVDGHRLSRFFREHSVFPPVETEEIMKAFHELCRSVLLATLVSGLAQAATYLVGLLIAGVGGIPLITLMVFLASFIPLFGAGPITFGFALYTLIASETTSAGIILLIFASITGVVDNFVKPMVLKGAANLHPLIALVSLFGGLEVFGFTGVFLGPLFVGVFLVSLNCMLRTWVRAPD